MMYYFSPAAGTGWHTYKSLGWEVMHQAQCTSDSVEPILQEKLANQTLHFKSTYWSPTIPARRSFADVFIVSQISGAIYNL